MSETTPPHAHLPETSPEPEEPAGIMPRLPARTWVLVGAGLAAMTAIASWFGIASARQPVRWQDVGYTVESPFTATVTFDVFLYTDAPVTCHVRALNIRFAEVGGADLAVDPARGAHQRLTASVTTTETANTVVVDRCETTP